MKLRMPVFRAPLVWALLLAVLPVAAARAGETLSTSTDPTAAIGAPIDAQLVALLGQEREALGAARPKLRSAVRLPWAATGRSAPKIDAAWLARQPEPAGDAQFECLAKAVYFEARGEAIDGQVAVAEVVLNRVDSPRFPETICEVVHQARTGRCQFSWTCDGKSDKVRNPAAWDRAARIARAMIDGAPRRLTGGATYYHAGFVRPFWASHFTQTAQIGGHLFYRREAPQRVN